MARGPGAHRRLPASVDLTPAGTCHKKTHSASRDGLSLRARWPRGASTLALGSEFPPFEAGGCSILCLGHISFTLLCRGTFVHKFSHGLGWTWCLPRGETAGHGVLLRNLREGRVGVRARLRLLLGPL